MSGAQDAQTAATQGIPRQPQIASAAANRAALLEGPITRQILHLAWPVFVVLALQTFVGIAETYFVSFLGTDALAGVLLVLPLFMVMRTILNGGIGGGVSSAVARALGRGASHDTQALALHAVVTGALFGTIFMLSVWVGGSVLFRCMGAHARVLSNAVLYANVLFVAAIPGGIASLLAATLRGAGNVRTPAIITASGSFAALGLSPIFIFGWGWVPAFGVAGAGLALICLNCASASALALYMRSSRSPIRLTLTKLEWRLFKDILKVGLLSAVGTLASNLSVVVTTGLVGAYGPQAIAGYGVASRIDYILTPLLFALGTASVTMVGTNVGAAQQARAHRIAQIGAALAVSVTGAIGLAAAFFPYAWMHIFSSEAQVVQLGAAYLTRVAPFYVLYGIGMALYFASQGAGRMAWPFAASCARLAIVAVAGSFWINSVNGPMNGLYWIVATSYIAFGSINAYAVMGGRSWRHARPVRRGITRNADAPPSSRHGPP